MFYLERFKQLAHLKHELGQLFRDVNTGLDRQPPGGGGVLVIRKFLAAVAIFAI